MNRLTEASRINAIRERLLEKKQMGLLGVIAAKANVPEYVLSAWCNSPVDVPHRDMLVKIQDAVSEPIVMSTTRDDMQQFGTEGENHGEE